jgi:glycosyltransferase involved in cell wall biosynthesis
MIDCAFLYTKLGPHMRAWMNSTAKHLRCLVIELSGDEARYPWENLVPLNCESCVVSPSTELSGIDLPAAQTALRGILERTRPRVLFSCRYDLELVRYAARLSKQMGSASVLMSDSWAADHRRWWVKERIKSLMLRRLYDGAIVAGQRSRDYALSLGFKPDAIWTGIDVVDNGHFERVTRQTDSDPQAYRSQLRLPEHFFLVVARHVKEKNLFRMLEALALYRKRGGSWPLVICGTGPQTEALRQTSLSLHCADAVDFRGWVGYSDTPRYYALSNALILPSISEPWGLVVNEAMACSRVVLVSDVCGCAPELVHRGVNGYTFDPLNTYQLAALMTHVEHSDETVLSAMGMQSRLIVEQFSHASRDLAIMDCCATLARGPANEESVRKLSNDPQNAGRRKLDSIA